MSQQAGRTMGSFFSLHRSRPTDRASGLGQKAPVKSGQCIGLGVGR